MVPHDDFTPFGYLDNPYHSWKLNPSGVLRSMEPLGMGWHVPNLGSYVNNQFQYTAHLSIGLKIGKTVLVTPEDFRRQKCAITSTLHTTNRFEYTCVVPKHGLTLTARYFLAHEHALGCILTLSTTSTAPQPVTCYLIHQHWQQSIGEIVEAESRHSREDGAFWQHAPQLAGDWPANWRRGLVYDLETLRMMMRRPAGIIPHTWDAMQIRVAERDLERWRATSPT